MNVVLVIIVVLTVTTICDSEKGNYFSFDYPDYLYDYGEPFQALDAFYDDIRPHHFHDSQRGGSKDKSSEHASYASLHIDPPHSFNAAGYGLPLGEDMVETTHGKVRAQTKVIRTGSGDEVKIDIFWAIPYAKPPVGQLRFKRPEPAEPWKGVRESYGPPKSCLQVNDPDPPILPNPRTPFSEDCLYLTVWRPRCQEGKQTRFMKAKKSEGEGLATLVYIHGGGFMTGSTTASIYNPEVLSATECIIVAAMNYRLGALGFIFLDIPDAPGNMGLLDMTLALRWINVNLRNFGGDPERITVAGFSVGASSTSLFLLSPLTRYLFSRAIMQSGASTSFLTMQSTVSALEVAHKFATSLGCTANVHTEIIECLRGVDASILTQQHYILSQSSPDYVMTAIVDHHFLYRSPQRHLENRDFKQCELLLGCMQDEGTFFMRSFWPQVYSFKAQVPRQITSKDLDSKLTTFFGKFLKKDFIPEVIKDVKRVYQLWKLWGSQDGHRLLLNQVLGDTIFACDIRLLAGMYANASQDVYLYKFAHPHDWSKRPYWVGALHGSGLDFVFGRAAVDHLYFSPREAELSKLVMAYWGNFIKHGSPSPEGFYGPEWLTYSSPDPGSYMHFAESTDVFIGKTEDHRCRYWHSLPEHYFKS